MNRHVSVEPPKRTSRTMAGNPVDAQPPATPSAMPPAGRLSIGKGAGFSLQVASPRPRRGDLDARSPRRSAARARARRRAGRRGRRASCSTGEIVARGAQRPRARRTTPPRTPRCCALRDAARHAGTWRLDDHALVVTLEPCPMSAGAAWAARVRSSCSAPPTPRPARPGSLYNLAADPRLNHEIDVVPGVLGRGVRGAAHRRSSQRGAGSRDPVTSRPGGMRERPNRMVSKTIVAQVTVGSNPTPSARFARRSRPV